MYCPNCACELPTVAKFCVRCGATTRFVEAVSSARPFVSIPLGPTPVITPKRLGDQVYCGKCGTKAIGGNLFCTSCGNPLYEDDVPGPPNLLTHSDAEVRETEFTPILPTALHHNSATVQIQETTATEDVLAPLEPIPDAPGGTLTEPISSSVIPGANAVATNGIEPPVVRFVLQALGTMLTVSVIAFAVADDIARSALSVWLPLLVAVFILPFLLYRTIKTLGTLKHLSVADEAVGQARIRLLKQSIVFGVLFTIISSGVGYGIGTSGSETHRLLTDQDRYAAIGKRISDQRNSGGATVPTQIAMYDRLEPDVRDFARICATLHAELTVFDGKYPGQHQTTEASLHNIDNGAKRAALLLQEIEVARRIASLEGAQQWTVWKSDMLPLLDQEDALK